MVFRLPLLSSLWVPVTICLFAAQLSISEVSEAVVNEDDPDGESTSVNKTKRNLTGIPQIDYLTDPNLPRELNGYNLSSYPFFNKVPTNITFQCDGLKDGFYASVEHQCQLYHHCLFGTRYDFLCANYTAFDQRTFICQFVSEVDCPNSPLFFNRNDALYVAKSTTPAPIQYGAIGGGGEGRSRGRQRYTPSPLLPNKNKQSDLPVDSTKQSSPAESSGGGGKEAELQKHDDTLDDYQDGVDNPGFYRQRPRGGGGRPRGLRRRPGRRRLRPRPAYYDYDYYDYVDDEPYVRRPPRTRDRYDDYYETDSEEELPKRRVNKRKHRRRQYYNSDREGLEDDGGALPPVKASKLTESQKIETISSAKSTITSTTELPPLDPIAMSRTREELFTQSRAPPRIKPPVPLNERNKYNQMQGRILVDPSSSPSAPSSPTTTEQTSRKKNVTPVKTATAPAAVEVEQYDQTYYDDDYEQTQAAAPAKKSNKYLPLPPTTPSTTTTTSTTTTKSPTTTTTPAPQTYEDYEYEEYEDEQPIHPKGTTTTTTTTTTPKPSIGNNNNNNRKFRNNRKRQEDSGQGVGPSAASTPTTAAETVSTSGQNEKYGPTSSSGPGSRQEVLDVPSSSRVPPSSRQPYMTRPRPTFFSKNSQQPTTTTSTERTVDSYRLTPDREMNDRDQRYRVYEESVETTTQRGRTSRFWQRQPKVAEVTTTTTTSTTPAPQESSDYAYYDENIPYGLRYGASQRYMAESPLLHTPIPSEPQPTDSLLNYQQQQQQLQNYRANSYVIPKVPEQSNFVTPFGPSKTTASTYLQFHQPHQQQQAQPPPQQQQQQSSVQSQPEFISLLPDDEEESFYPTGSSDARSSHIMTHHHMMSPDAQSQPTQSLPQPQSQHQHLPIQVVPQTTRFRNQITRMFASPQELYPTYAPPPQYIKQVRPRHIFPTMFIPYGTF